MKNFFQQFLVLLAFLFLRIAYGAEPPTVDYTANTKIKVDAGTQADADAALKTVNEFLVLWNEGKVEQAAEMVETRMRTGWHEEMKKKPLKLQSIDALRIFSGTKNPILGRVHFSSDPKPGRPDLKKSQSAIDMVLIDGKWWISAR